MFIQFYSMSGVVIGAIKITLKNSVGIFVITGKNRNDIIDKAFAELKLKIEQQNLESNLEIKAENEQIEPSQAILSPYIFA